MNFAEREQMKLIIDKIKRKNVRNQIKNIREQKEGKIAEEKFTWWKKHSKEHGAEKKLQEWESEYYSKD